MYIYVRGSSSYNYYSNTQKLYDMATNFARQLKQYEGYSSSELSQFPDLKKQLNQISNMYNKVRKDDSSKNSLYTALDDLVEHDLYKVPQKFRQLLNAHGIPGNVVDTDMDTSEFYPIDYDRSRYYADPSGYQGTFRWDAIKNGIPRSDGWDWLSWNTTSRNLGAEISISGRPEWIQSLPDIQDSMRSYVSSLVRGSVVPDCDATFHIKLVVDSDVVGGKRGGSGIIEMSGVSGNGDPRGPQDDRHAWLYAALIVTIGASADHIQDGLDTIIAEAGGMDEQEVSRLLRIINRIGTPRRRSSSTSSEWSKTIDLRDYFPDECFDEDGNFDEYQATDDDWIDFNMYDLKDGFGNPRKLYNAVLNKAGVPAYSEFITDRINNGGVDTDGNLEFILYGDSSFEIPNIHFGFDMNVTGSKAKVVLAYAEVVE